MSAIAAETNIDIGETENWNRSPLLNAIIAGNLEKVKKFLQEKLDVNETNSRGETALNMLIKNQKSLSGSLQQELFYLLLDAGLKINFSYNSLEEFLNLPLAQSIRYNNGVMLKLLIAWGGDVKASIENINFINIAIAEEKPDLIPYLFAAGVDIENQMDFIPDLAMCADIISQICLLDALHAGINFQQASQNLLINIRVDLCKRTLRVCGILRNLSISSLGCNNLLYLLQLVQKEHLAIHNSDQFLLNRISLEERISKTVDEHIDVILSEHKNVEPLLNFFISIFTEEDPMSEMKNIVGLIHKAFMSQTISILNFDSCWGEYISWLVFQDKSSENEDSFQPPIFSKNLTPSKTQEETELNMDMVLILPSSIARIVIDYLSSLLGEAISESNKEDPEVPHISTECKEQTELKEQLDNVYFPKKDRALLSYELFKIRIKWLIEKLSGPLSDRQDMLKFLDRELLANSSKSSTPGDTKKSTEKEALEPIQIPASSPLLILFKADQQKTTHKKLIQLTTSPKNEIEDMPIAKTEMQMHHDKVP